MRRASATATRLFDSSCILNLTSEREAAMSQDHHAPSTSSQEATFGGGCFWCTEAIYRELRGVEAVISGYAGGHVDNPTYRQVCNGETGHAEVIRVRFDPAEVDYGTLLRIFFATHDPTTRNRQGNDVGPQYRSVIFYHDEQQKEIAEKVLAEAQSERADGRPIVTEIIPLTNFFPAEDYHQDYFALNSSQPYCQLVISPKLDKFRKEFASERAES